ncbi:MAG: GTP-binding protein [Candidatus Lokiarchaeota archaeon]|nr:GTP-binding protein [Candidatus Lokiarchaeota archaeon]
MSFLKKLFGRSKKQVNIAIVGLDNAGKTTLLNFLIEGEPTETIPTMGVNYKEIKMKKIKLNMMDLGGQVAFRKFWKGPIQTSQVLIFVIDGADPERFDEANKELNKALEIFPDDLPILILVNKCDLDNFVNKDRIIEYFEFDKLLGRDWHIENTSALLGHGLTESFHWLYERVSGKKIKKKLVPEDILIFNESGIPIISKSKVFKESTLTAGLLSAINSFVNSTTDQSLTSLTMGKYKVVFQHMKEIIGALVMNSYENDKEGNKILKEILEEINTRGLEFAEQILTNYILDKIKNI